MGNNLPTPKARLVGGVAHVSTWAIVGFQMAHGIPINDIAVSATPTADEKTPEDHTGRVHNVSDSKKARDWIEGIKEGHFGADGAPNSKNGGPKFERVVCLSLSDWTDGFGPGKVKNNRNSVDVKSFTVSPPKHLVNGTANTFPVAIGLKKAKGWPEVERIYQEEAEKLTSSKEPVLLCSGAVGKLVPCFFKRFVVMSDKAERNGLTAPSDVEVTLTGALAFLARSRRRVVNWTNWNPTSRPNRGGRRLWLGGRANSSKWTETQMDPSFRPV